MTGIPLETSLRRLLARFKLPGEAQKIDRLLLSFAEHYNACNPAVFESKPAAYILSFSMILLNTDLHHPNNHHRITKDTFIMNCRAIEETSNLPESVLSSIYEAIEKDELTTEVEGIFDYPLSLSDIEGILWKKSDRFHSWNRRWCVVANGCLYYFTSKRDKSPRGVIPLEDLIIRPLNRRGTYRFEITADEVDESWLGGSVNSTVGSSTVGNSLQATIASGTSSVQSNLSSQSSLFRTGPNLPLIKSAKYVNGQLVEGRRDRYVFQCESEEERDRWIATLTSRMQHRPTTVSGSPQP